MPKKGATHSRPSHVYMVKTLAETDSILQFTAKFRDTEAHKQLANVTIPLEFGLTQIRMLCLQHRSVSHNGLFLKTQKIFMGLRTSILKTQRWMFDKMPTQHRKCRSQQQGHGQKDPIPISISAHGGE